MYIINCTVFISNCFKQHVVGWRSSPIKVLIQDLQNLYIVDVLLKKALNPYWYQCSLIATVCKPKWAILAPDLSLTQIKSKAIFHLRCSEQVRMPAKWNRYMARCLTTAQESRLWCSSCRWDTGQEMKCWCQFWQCVSSLDPRFLFLFFQAERDFGSIVIQKCCFLHMYVCATADA